MTLDHFGKPISHYLYQCFGFFSAAEGFFFLSGYVGMLAATSKSSKDPTQNWMKFRALKTLRYHLATLLILCILGYWFLPNIYGNFKSIFQHPLEGLCLSVMLVHTPLWLDVLPLYVIFLLLGSFIFPLFIKAKNKTQVILLWIPSLLIWLWSQFGLRDLVNQIFPSWVFHGSFNPYSWQFIYFSGAAMAAWWKRAKEDAQNGKTFAVSIVKKLTPALIAILVFCFLWSHNFIPIPQPSEIFISKDDVGILRFANFLTFVLFICWTIRIRPTLLDFKPTNVLGLHSLDVYTAHIFLIYMWFSTPDSIRYHAPWNVIVPIAACVVLWALAKFREPRR